MPRIDPLQLLKCLSVLLSPSGGIKSKEEVQRLASLMTKFSKKLVSKCIYIQILKTTDSELLGMFMSAGGWNLIHMWLSDAIVAKNWPLIQELLELLLSCPVDVERLRINNCPKLIKGLQKDGSTSDVRILATRLVEQWLKIVKGGSPAQPTNSLELGKTVCASVAESGTSPDPSTRINSSAETVPSEPHTEVINLTNTEPAVQTAEPETVVTSGSVFIKAEEEVKKEEKEERKRVEETEVKTEVKVEEAEVMNKVPMCQEESANNVLVQEKAVDKESVTSGGPDEVATSEDSGEEVGAWNGPVGQLPVYKITIRDGKQVLAKVYSGDRTNKKSSDVPSPASTDPPKLSIGKGNSISNKTNVSLSDDEIVMEVNSEVKPSDAKVSVSTKSKLDKTLEVSKSKKDGQKKSKDGHSNIKTPDKKSKHLESNKEKSKETSKEKTKEKKEKHKEKENNKLKEKKPVLVIDQAQMEKDKATLAKLIPPTISKLGKIPKVKKSEESLKPPEVKKEEEVKKSDIKKPPPVVEVKKPPVPVVEPKKSSISIEVRRNDGVRPKTVKKFHSKFRSTGLEEEVKPPPSRPVKKVPPPLPEKKPIKFPTLKRPSPPRDVPAPVPEKKLKPLIPEIIPEEAKKTEKNGSIKLIPPRPKPCFLQESDMFMDALTASSMKKEPKKRKRRFSLSKDDKKEANSKEETTPPSSPPGDEIKSPPVVKPTLKFYQDTLEAEEERLDEEEVGDTEKQDEGSMHRKDEGNAENEDLEPEEKLRRLSGEETPGSMSPSGETPKPQRTPGGVLTYAKLRTGPKKVVRWKPEKELEVIRYFELDETERVNVTKTFLDMKQMERTHEREAFMLARKLPQDDNMEEKTHWLPLIPIDLAPSLAEPGKLSREKDIQYAREKGTLQAIYFNRAMIPDSPAEPDMEIHATTDPAPIPLDDVTGNADSVNDFQNTPWPDPKPMLIPQSPPQPFPVQQQPQFPSFASPSYSPPHMYPNQPVMANNMPGPGPVNMMHPNPMSTGSGDWRNGDGKVITMNDMSPPMDMYNQGVPPMNPNMGMPMHMNMNMGMPSNMGPGMPPDMNYNMMGGEDMNQFPPQGFQMGGPPNMFNYRGGRGPGMGMGNGPVRAGRGNRGGPWFRPMGNGGGNWQGGGRGGRGGNWGGPSRTICKHFRSGFCRQAEKCPYLHPGVNGPPQY